MKIQQHTIQALRTAVLLAVFALSISSCHYKDFDDYEDNDATWVVLDWSELDSTARKPEIMRAVFYPFDGSMRPFTVYVKDSAMVYLPVGQYRVFAYNDDSDILRIDGTDSNFGVPFIYTDKASLRGIFAKDSVSSTGTYYDYPDRTYTEYTGAAITAFTSNRIVLRPKEVTRDVIVIVDGIRNQNVISSVRLSLDGVSNSYSPLMPARFFVAMAADAELHQSDDRITSGFHVYGLDRSPHTLQLFITGQRFRRLLSFDVTDMVNDQINSDRPVIIHVCTDYDAEDDVPVDATGNIGVGVDDWPSEDIPLDF